MNRPIFFGLVAGLLFLSFSCSTINVSTDYNQNFNFSDLKTYAWLDNGKAPSDDARVNSELVADGMRKAVEQTLAGKGYVKAEGDTADFVVSWLGGIDKKIRTETIDHFYSPYGYGSLYRGSSKGSTVPSPVVNEYEVGTLIIDILDPVEHKVIWRGSGQDRIREKKNPEKVRAGLREAVKVIMKDFPPEH